MYAEVVLARATRRTDKIYHYSIPQALTGKIQVGHQVVIPFGQRREVGFVVGFVDQPAVKQVKDIIKLATAEPLLSQQQIELARWLAEYYLCFLSTALRCVLPPGGRI